MFGSVTPGQVADELKRQFEIVLEKRKIHIEKPIRTLGEHEVELRLHHGVHAALKVRVESTTPVAAPVEAAPAADKGGDRRTEKAGKPRDPRAEKAEKGA
jgi:large subunit ribosomal protein L9